MHERIAAKYHLISENDFKKIDYKRIGLLLSNFVAMLLFFFQVNNFFSIFRFKQTSLHNIEQHVFVLAV